MGQWAWGNQELTTTVDKFRVIRGLVPEDRLAPRVQVNLDDLEEDLDDYGEYIQAEGGEAGDVRGPATPEEFRGEAAGGGGPRMGPEGEAPEEGERDVEAQGGEQREAEGGATGQGLGAGEGGAHPPGDRVSEGTEEAIKKRGEEEPVLGPSGLGRGNKAATPRGPTGSPGPDEEGDSRTEPASRGPQTRGAQQRALLADALLRKGASFRHIRQLSLPWRGSKRAAADEAEGELAKKKGKEPETPSEPG